MSILFFKLYIYWRKFLLVFLHPGAMVRMGASPNPYVAGILEEEELTEEPERSDRKGVIIGQGHMVTEALAGALGQGSHRAE